MTELVVTPEDGSTWLCDAAIDTGSWLESVTGEDLSEELEAFAGEDGFPDWDGGSEEDEATFIAFIGEREDGRKYHAAARDNVYNHENDFSEQFTWTIYAPTDSADWCWEQGCYVAVCHHMGGDVRGNYSGPALFRLGCPAESGFTDWMLGWYVEGCEDAERLNEEFSPGYHSNPGSAVADRFGDRGEWRGGVFYFEDPEGSPTGVSAIPYHFCR